MFGGGAGDMFGGDQGKAMATSFKEFLSRPENRPLVEKHQRREVKQAVQLQEKTAALRFRDKVLESEYDAQVAIAPFLRNKVLRRIVQTFSNDPNGDFSKWATNTRVIEMLKEAQKLMDDGRLTEKDAEEFMLRMLRDPQNEYHQEFEAKTKQVARLPTDQLVQALNEHLTERRQGNTAYRSGDYPKALEHYQRAKSIVDLVRGLSRADQHEVDINKIAVLCNIAAVHLATKEFGAAIEICNKALDMDATCVKALTRRCKAFIGRHEYDAAQADIENLKTMGGSGNNNHSGEVAAADLAVALQHAQVADKRLEAKTFGNMFDRNSTGLGTSKKSVKCIVEL